MSGAAGHAAAGELHAGRDRRSLPSDFAMSTVNRGSEIVLEIWARSAPESCLSVEDGLVPPRCSWAGLSRPTWWVSPW